MYPPLLCQEGRLLDRLPVGFLLLFLYPIPHNPLLVSYSTIPSCILFQNPLLVSYSTIPFLYPIPQSPFCILFHNLLQGPPLLCAEGLSRTDYRIDSHRMDHYIITLLEKIKTCTGCSCLCTVQYPRLFSPQTELITRKLSSLA
jgi:hypothetical protein